MKESSTRPAAWMIRLIGPLVGGDEREYVVGDLVESFATDTRRRGVFSAYRRLLIDAVSTALLSRSRQRITSPSPFNRPEPIMDILRHDLSHTIRGIVRSPAFSILSAVTLGLGIGATATMFGVVERVVLRGPDHVVDPGSLVRAYAVIRHGPGETETGSITGYAMFTALRDRTHSFFGVAAYQSSTWIVGTGVDARSLPGMAASATLFPTLGVRPYLGRFYNEGEDRPNSSADVVVLSYEYWRRELGADSSAIGRPLNLGFRPFTIIGVAPPGFTGPELQPIDFWLPLSSGAHPRPDWPTTWQARWLQVIGRLKPHISVAQANADVTVAFHQSYNGPNADWRSAHLELLPISYTSDGVESPVAPIARWLTAVAMIVLLIACANVANLLITRRLRRRHELAVRLALGLGRWRLTLLLAGEAAAVAVLGGFVGVVIAFFGGQIIRRFFLDDLSWTGSTIDARIVGAAAGLTIGAGLFVSAVSLLSVRPGELTDALKAGPRASGGRMSSTRTALVFVQSTLTIVLLIGAGLFVRSLDNARSIDLGIQTDRVLVASVFWPATPGPDAATRQAESWKRIRDSISHHREFEGASLAIGTPFRSAMGVDIRVPGFDSLPTLGGGGPYVIAVGPDYFTTVGTRISRGRAFLPSEGAQSARTVIVNETMARTLWPNEDPLGKCLIIGEGASECSSVVGMVPEAHRFGIREEPAMQYYIPLGQESGISGTSLLARPRPGAKTAGETLRKIVAGMAPAARYVDVGALQDRVDPQIRPWRLGAAMFGLFGTIALVVAAAGLYGVIAYGVTQRTHEFGVRMAVGANASSIIRLVVGQALRVVAVASVAGAATALLLGGRIEAQLFNESARDPLVYAVVIGSMALVSVAASLAPAARAATVDPASTLRQE